MSRSYGSQLSAPPVGVGEHPGALLGFPRSGPGSLVALPRRVVALCVDWFIAMGIAALLVHGGAVATATLGVWFVVGLLTVAAFGFTPGQFFLGLRVIRADATCAVGFARAFVRQVLLVFVIPALFTDSDGRGMHDRATGTALVRSR